MNEPRCVLCDSTTDLIGGLFFPMIKRSTGKRERAPSSIIFAESVFRIPIRKRELKREFMLRK
jgi:hypothetical protein